VFNALDSHLWKLTYRWAIRSHRNKPKTWVVDRYYGAFNTNRDDRWVFGDRDSGAYLRKFSWTPIVRHQLVKGAASPDDPSLAAYWANRRRKRRPPPLDHPPSASWRPRVGDAQNAGTTCYTPTPSHSPPTNGRSGSPPSARPCANKRWPCMAATAAISTISCTAAAIDPSKPRWHGPARFCQPASPRGAR